MIDDKAVQCAWKRTLSHRFTYSLVKKKPTSIGNLMRKAQKHIQANEKMSTKRLEIGAFMQNKEFLKDPEPLRRNKGDKSNGKKVDKLQ